MSTAFFQMIKRITVASVVRTAFQRRNVKIAIPEPVRRSGDNAGALDDPWLFETGSEAIAQRLDMLGAEMATLSNMLSGVRGLLSDYDRAATEAGAFRQYETPFIADDLLFDEALAQEDGQVVWEDEDFLFEKERAPSMPAFHPDTPFLRFEATA